MSDRAAGTASDGPPTGAPPILLPESRGRIDLVSGRLGGRALHANDEFFAPKERLVDPAPPVFREGLYTDRGKWMDGWETRRRREPGHDWCVLRLGIPGRIREAVVDTTHFRGNHPEAASLDAVELPPDTEDEAVPEAAERVGGWVEILPRTPLVADAENRHEVEADGRWTHVRLHIYPDGGVARLRLPGEARPDPGLGRGRAAVDLAALAHGGIPIACSDESFGEPRNLLLPGPPVDMGEGWETRRRRGPGHDWVVVRLGARGSIEAVEVDTTHFKGNHPARCGLEVADAGPALETSDAAGRRDEARLLAQGAPWRRLLGETPLAPDRVHRFAEELAAGGPATHVRLRIFPDGGVARLRVFGRPTDEPG